MEERSRHKAFTLIELLVVISIIGLLTAILGGIGGRVSIIDSAEKPLVFLRILFVLYNTVG